MCELCLKQLKHEAVEYFRCLYDYDGRYGKRNFLLNKLFEDLHAEELDKDEEMSEETYNQIIAMHECMKLHEILKMIADREEALYQFDQTEKTVGVVERVIDTFNLDEKQKKEYMIKFKKLYKEEIRQKLEKLYEELD